MCSLPLFEPGCVFINASSFYKWLDQLYGGLVACVQIVEAPRVGEALVWCYWARGRKRSLPIKKLTVGICLLITGVVGAQSQRTHVQEGNALGKLAELLKTHGGATKHNSGHHSSSQGSHVVSISHSYTVRNGDVDWTIARHHDTTVHKLHLANPGIDWDALRPGTKLHMPGTVVALQPKHSSSAKKSTKVAKAHAPKLRGVAYTVKSGENDWILAHKAHVRVGVLKDINPGVNIANLHPGQKIRVPACLLTAQAEAKISRIHSHYAVVNKDDVTLRRSPSRDGAAITTVDEGTRVVVLDRNGAWYKLRFPKGSVGWVRGDMLSAAAAPHVTRVASHRSHRSHSSSHSSHHSSYVAMDSGPVGDSDGLIRRARSFTGTPYRWGQASRSGTDCSGFTTQVYRGAGVRLPRTSHEQAEIGQKVSRDELKKGDLVFFHTMGGHKVSHVGIYVGGNKFIHASSKHGVKESSLDEAYYRNHFVGARRVKK